MRASHSSLTLTSHAAPVALTPNPSSSRTVCFTSSTLRAPTQTFKPSRASASAIARPMPFVPPVTTAAFPLYSTASPRLHLLFQKLVDDFRIRFALRGLHPLTDEEAEERLLAAAVSLD